MKLLKAILIQLVKVGGWAVAIAIFFTLWIIVMEYVFEPIVDWLNLVYGLGGGLLLIFGTCLIILPISAFVLSIKDTYKKL